MYNLNEIKDAILWRGPRSVFRTTHENWHGFTEAKTRPVPLRFDLPDKEHYVDWSGKLIVGCLSVRSAARAR
jgi:hypothetical protein